MNQAVADRVGDARFPDGGMPGRGRQLAGDQRRGAFAAVFEDLEEIAPLAIRERREQPVVDGQQIELGELREELAVGAVAAADGEIV